MTPKPLRDKRLFSVDLGALVAGASHRGEFEARLKKLLKYVLDSKGRVILFIDEIHMLLGTGKSEGPMDAANLLKPAMARGEVRIVGATTHDEYKIIEKDAALERRFKPIMVEEPPTSQAISILQRLRPSFEKHHEMLIPDEAITAAVLLSQKYIKHRRLPDKAIDLVDEACAAKRAQLEMGEETGEPELPKRPVGVFEKPGENAHVRRLQGHEVGAFAEKGPARSRVDANWRTEVKKRILDEMSASGLLRREIADRLSGVILFEPISPSNVKKIITIQMRRLVDQLGARNVEFAMDDSAANLIIQNVYSDTSGVRQLKKYDSETIW
eukprot:XP_028343946.1 uncharacterized protein LOC114486043 [Physeter catodon]